VFRKLSKGKGIEEEVMVALGVRTKQQGYSPKDDAIVEEALSAIDNALTISINRDIDKGVAEFSLSKLLEGLPKPERYEPYQKSVDVQFKPYSTYPFISRDIALWVLEGVSASEVENVLNAAAGELRVRTTLFDEFTKDGRVSYAFRLVFQSYEKTLTDAEVNTIMDRITAAVSERRWEVR
jgi:phenylalanyl-tRNA synthetase beta subunit